MAGPGPCPAIDSAIEELDRLEIGSYTTRKELKMGLNFLKTVVMYAVNWGNVDEDVHKRLGDLMIDIQDEFAEASFDLADAEERGDEAVNEIYSILLGKIELFKPKVSDAFDYLSNYAIQPRSPILDFRIWDKILDAISENKRDLSYSKNLTGPLKRNIEALNESLRSLHLFLIYLNSSGYFSSRNTVADFWTYLGAVATGVARLSCFCGINKLDESQTRDVNVLISDLQQKIKPCTPEIVGIYLRFLIAIKIYSSDQRTVPKFLETAVPMKDLSEGLFQGLVFLIQFLVKTPEEYANDVKLISVDIKTVISRAVSLNSSLNRRRRENELERFYLLQKIELLKAESVLMQLMNSKITADKAPIMQSSDNLLNGVKFLHAFLKNPPRGVTEKGKLILTHVEAAVAGAGSLYDTFHANQITEDNARDVLKLLVNIKLLKAEVFWLGSISNNTSLKDQVETLHGELEFLRKIVSDASNRNSENGKLILARVDEVASRAISIYYTIHANQVAEDFTDVMNNLLPDLLEKINLLKAEAKDMRFRVRHSPRYDFPKTDGLGFLDFFLENLRKLQDYKADSIESVKHQIEVVHRDMKSLRSSFRDIAELRNEHPELEDLYTHILCVAYEADYSIDSIVLRNGAVWYHMLCLSDIIEDIKLLKAQVIEINVKKYATGDKPISTTSEASSPMIEEVIVDLNREQQEIVIGQLTRGSRQRDIVSIVGMPGIGKTTLAKKAYNDPNTEKHFHVRAWGCVSQTYQKRDLLLELFGFVREPTDQVEKESDETLAHLLRQRLMGRKYLIVLDDLWDINAWNDMESSFPNNENGSRVLITSRDHEVALKIKGNSDPLSLRLLKDDESWTLLEEKLFHKKRCPEELMKAGKRIANGCKGLPLAIVAVAGLLERTEKQRDWWEQIAADLDSRIAEDPKSRCMDILELSYKHLPNHLKPCFLYCGAFLKDREIPVRKLTSLWIAEGFVRQVDPNDSVEDAADSYLRDLIGRSLVMATKIGSKGGVKACRVHDILRNLCLTKAGKDNFLKPITGYDEHFPSSSSRLDYGVDSDYSCASNTITYEQHRLSICSRRKHLVMLKPYGPRVRSLLFFATNDSYPRCPYDVSFISDNFRLLRVLDFESINMGNGFPSGIELLKQLRYLAVCGDFDSVPTSIGKLWNLEVLSVKGLKGEVAIPDAIWSMASLRNLHVNDVATFTFQDEKLKNSSEVVNLVTVSSLSLFCGEVAEKIMKRLATIRKLKCRFSEPKDHSGSCNRSPVLRFLTQIKSLKISYYGSVPHSCEFTLASTLEKLTLSNCHLPREYISRIGSLRYLKVLKLLSVTFDEQKWDMIEEEFVELEHLKLDTVDIVQWNAYSDHLPKLRRLLLRSCKHLEAVPSGFGEMATLQMIELQWCSQSAENSVKQIQMEQVDSGNEEFKLFINIPSS